MNKIEMELKAIEKEVRDGMARERKEIDEADFRKFLKAERRRLKKLKHAGVLGRHL